jgi:hypothetical protein
VVCQKFIEEQLQILRCAQDDNGYGVKLGGTALKAESQKPVAKSQKPVAES